MNKLILAIILSVTAITAQSQTVENCDKNEFIAILKAQHLSTTQCLDAKDCQDYLDGIKANCTPDMIIQQGLSVKKAIANIQRKKDNFVSSAKEAKRLVSLPGVVIGMSANKVINESSWGKPRSVNTTTTAAGVREQWVYGGNNYLYFTNGVLTAIQN